MTAAGDFASLSDGETFLLLAALVAVIGSILVTTLRTGVPPMPSNSHVAATMLALVPADTRGVIYELGAGWGGPRRGTDGGWLPSPAPRCHPPTHYNAHALMRF